MLDIPDQKGLRCRENQEHGELSYALFLLEHNFKVHHLHKNLTSLVGHFIVDDLGSRVMPSSPQTGESLYKRLQESNLNFKDVNNRSHPRILDLERLDQIGNDQAT